MIVNVCPSVTNCPVCKETTHRIGKLCGVPHNAPIEHLDARY